VDQRRFPGEPGDPLLGAAVENRQQLLEAPDVPGALVDRPLGDPLLREVVVVVDVEPFAAGGALEGFVEERRPVAAVAAGEFGRTGAGPEPVRLGEMRIHRVTHDSSFAADPSALVQLVSGI
jgi:hypothetical protein